MVKSFKKKKKLILFILYDFQKKFQLFFSKFQFQNWNFQNWNLGNMWTQNTQTHPPTSPTQHTNTPTNPPKIKTLITHKHTTHNPQTHNTQHKHCCGCTTGPKKQNRYECRRVRRKGAQYVDCGQPNLKIFWKSYNINNISFFYFFILKDFTIQLLLINIILVVVH